MWIFSGTQSTDLPERSKMFSGMPGCCADLPVSPSKLHWPVWIYVQPAPSAAWGQCCCEVGVLCSGAVRMCSNSLLLNRPPGLDT